MFNTGKLRKVNNLISAANSCVDNRDVKGARTALSQANDILKKIHGNKTQELLDWMTAAEKLNNLAKELHEAELTPEELQEEKKLAAKAKVENAKDKAEIDSNLEYVKWMNYFWEHRIENDEAMQQKYVPLEKEWYNKSLDEAKTNVTAAMVLNTMWLSTGLGVLKFGIEPYTYFSNLCKHAFNQEYTIAFRRLNVPLPDGAFLESFMQDDGFNYGSHYRNKQKKARSEGERKLQEENDRKDNRITKELENYELYPFSLNCDIEKNTSYAVKFLIKKWQEFCPSDIHSKDPEHRMDRLESLRAVYKTLYNLKDNDSYKEYTVNAFEFTTGYLNFVKDNN